MWVLLATAASVFWGIQYIFAERLYKHISVVTSLALSFAISAVLFFLVALSAGILRTDLSTLANSRSASWLLVTSTLALVVAELCIGFSISTRNATVAGLIEISYPLFIILFGYLFFKENNLNAGTIFGGLLIMGGVAALYLFNR